MTTRRGFIAGTGLAGGLLAAAGTAAATDEVSQGLHARIEQIPIDDSHCHPLGEADAATTVDGFIERIALSAFPGPAYFPEGVYDQWKSGDPATRQQLENRYGIGRKLDSINRHFETSIFVKYMAKEMASFLGCGARLAEVIEARNARCAQGYFAYVKDLFQDARIENVMLDTGYADGLDAAGIHRFEAAILPTKSHYIARVETITDELFEHDVSFNELRDSFVRKVRGALDGTGNFGRRSVGMKSYLLPDIGLIRPVYDDEVAADSWEELKRLRGSEPADRSAGQMRGKVLRERLLTIALEECLARDMPMQFHAGDGEAPSVTLRNQHPYYLEEIARFDRDGVMRMPKIIPIHAGYPLVSEAAWLSHLYANVYFELSLMTPFIHQGLAQRYLQIMEAVPLSKILFGSDAYHVPELYWLAARWGRRYLSQALAVYVRDGGLDEHEALQAAKMILHGNNRKVYNLDARA